MKNIILIGMKGSGKTTVGRLLAKKLHLKFIDSDRMIEKLHMQKKGEQLPFRKIYEKQGPSYFNQLDAETLKRIATEEQDFVLACAGRTPLQKPNRTILKKLGLVIYLSIDPQVLLPRIIKTGIPAFFPYQDNPTRSLKELLSKRHPLYKSLATVTLNLREETPDLISQKIKNYILSTSRSGTN